MALKTFFSPIDLRGDVRSYLEAYFSSYLNQQMSVYDIGCGDKPFSKALAGKVKEYIGVDIEEGFYDSSHIDLVGTAYQVPIDDERADAVISSQVIEHLVNPLDALKEAHRILKPGGLLFLSYPFLYPMHAVPHDYLRYTHFYIDQVLTDHCFEIIDSCSLSGFWYCAGVYMGIYLRSFDRGPLRWLGITNLVSWIFRLGFRVLHELEVIGLRIFGSSREKFCKMWTVNYILVAKKMSPK